MSHGSAWESNPDLMVENHPSSTVRRYRHSPLRTFDFRSRFQLSQPAPRTRAGIMKGCFAGLPDSWSIAALAAGITYVAAGRGAPPHLYDQSNRIRVVGQSGTLEVTAEAPNARFTELAITLEQNGRTVPLFALNRPAGRDCRTG